MFHCKCEYFAKTTHISSCLSFCSHISWFFWHYRCRWNRSRTGQRTSPLTSNNLAELSLCSSTMPQRYIRGHDGKCPRINPVNEINVKSLALPASTHIHASVHMYCTPARSYLSKSSFYFHLQRVWRDYVLCIKTGGSQRQKAKKYFFLTYWWSAYAAFYSGVSQIFSRIETLAIIFHIPRKLYLWKISHRK